MLRPPEALDDVTLSVCCLVKDGKLSLRIIEIKKHGSNRLPNSAQVAICGTLKTYVDLYHASLARFHKLQLDSQALEELFTALRVCYRHEFFKDTRNPLIAYVHVEYHDFILSLPCDEELLLKALSVLDNALHELQYHAPAHHQRIHVYYCDNLEGNLSNETIAMLASPLEHPVKEKPKKSLSCYVAEWMVNQIDKNADGLQSYKNAQGVLKDLLAINSVSLTSCIRNLLYPDPALDAFIKETCDQDNLMADILNPNIPHIKATLKVIDYIKKSLSPMEEALRRENRQTINAWFVKLESCRSKVWEQIVHSLIGKVATAKGHYESHYAEIALLKEASIIRNSDGLMELHFANSSTYKKCYAPDQPGEKVFKVELEHACQTLGLYFLPDQDFRSRAVFDKQSSIDLMNLGFHCHKEYFQRLIKLSHHFFWHTHKDVNLPRDMKAKIQAIANSLNHEEANIMAHKPTNKGP